MTTISDITRQIKPLPKDAPWKWLEAGWKDLWRTPLLSLGYGVAIVFGGVAIVAVLWQTGFASLIPVAFGVFAIVGPMLALGLYELSRRYEAGETAALFPVRFAGPRSITQVAWIGFILMFAALVWVRIAVMLFALFSNGQYVPLSDFLQFALTTGPGLGMLTVGTVVGGIIAFAIYLCTVVSLPMLMNERTDPFTGIAAGVVAVKTSPGAMILWAWLIVVLTVGGITTLFLGLAVVFPLLGHATWHAYRDIRGIAPQIAPDSAASVAKPG